MSMTQQIQANLEESRLRADRLNDIADDLYITGNLTVAAMLHDIASNTVREAHSLSNAWYADLYRVAIADAQMFLKTINAACGVQGESP